MSRESFKKSTRYTKIFCYFCNRNFPSEDEGRLVFSPSGYIFVCKYCHERLENTKKGQR